MVKLVSKKALADLAGVKLPAISYASKKFLKDCMVNDKIDIDHEIAKQWLKTRAKEKTRKTKRGSGRPKSTKAEAKKAAKKKKSPAPKHKKIPAKKLPAKKKPVSLKKKHHLPAEAIELPKATDKAAIKDNTLLIQEIRSLFPQLTKIADVKKFAQLTIQQLVDEFGSSMAAQEYTKILKTLEETRYKQLQISERSSKLIPREFVKNHIFSHLEGLSKRLLLHAPRSIVVHVYALAKAGEPLEEAEQAVRDILSKQLKACKSSVKKGLKNA